MCHLGLDWVTESLISDQRQTSGAGLSHAALRGMRGIDSRGAATSELLAGLSSLQDLRFSWKLTSEQGTSAAGVAYRLGSMQSLCGNMILQSRRCFDQGMV